MSSAISTRPGEPVGLDPDSEHDSLQAWQLFTLAGLIGATIVVFVSRGHTPAGIILLSLTIFAAAIVGVAAWRTFAPLVGADESGGAQMLAGRTRAGLEREKTLVLRSIKELEFDFAMKKVSEKDFAEMSARLRARAARLMRQLDASTTYRETIRAEVERRVGAAPVRSTKASGVTLAVCPSCAADTDGDARFCKHCGASLESTE